MKIGERYTARPLIWPTLRKAFAFLVLLIVLTIIEEVVVGLFHHQSVAASLGELFGARLYETLAGILIVLLVLIPYFAFHVLDEALGEGTRRGCSLSSAGPSRLRRVPPRGVEGRGPGGNDCSCARPD